MSEDKVVRPLWGNCGACGMSEAELALVLGNGGALASQSTAILGTAATL